MGVANLLLDVGANVNAMDWYGETPLWAAVDLRNLELGPADKATGIRDEAFALIERLLDAGADPNARTREFPHERRYIVIVVGSVAWVDLTGQTPFLRAAAAGDLRVMRLLLAARRGSEHRDRRRHDAADGRGRRQLGRRRDLRRRAGRAARGREARARARATTSTRVNSMGLAAIHGAANRGANDVIEYLAANGARLDVAGPRGPHAARLGRGVFLATHPPVRKPDTIALLERLLHEPHRRDTPRH